MEENDLQNEWWVDLSDISERETTKEIPIIFLLKLGCRQNAISRVYYYDCRKQKNQKRKGKRTKAEKWPNQKSYHAINKEDWKFNLAKSTKNHNLIKIKMRSNFSSYRYYLN